MEQKNTSESTMKNEKPKENSRPNETAGWHFEGHIKIFDPETGEVFQDKRNAIHYENMSVAMVNSLSNQGQGWIYQMAFGSGGTTVDPTGLITYLTPNNVGNVAALYNQTYYKTVDARQNYSLDPARNFMETRHVPGVAYSDVLVSCLLDFGEPSGQEAFDTATNSEGAFIFDELGLKSFSIDGPNSGMLITHVIFHPVQKSLNRLIQIDYTIRIQSLSNIGN